MAIDHDQRRSEIAVIAIDLIAREGLGAATIRRIAGEAGFSTAAVTNYFADKDELLVWAFEVLSAEGEQRFDAELARDPADGIDALMTMVPWCPANVRRWKAYLAFWDEAARNSYLARLMAQSTRTGLAYLQQLLRARAARPEGLTAAGELLNALIQGIALQMLVDPNSWPAAKTRDTLADAVQLAVFKSKG